MRNHSLLTGAALLLATTWAQAQAQPPAGSYSQSCMWIHVVGNVLKAKCKSRSGQLEDTSLTLPCNGHIDNNDGRLACIGAPAASLPAGSYLGSCGDARVQSGTLLANCRRVDKTVAMASLKLPCTGSIDNLNGVLTCTPPPPPPNTLTVTRMTGGAVGSQETGMKIWCGQDDYNNNPSNCTATFPKGTTVEIANYPMKAHVFGGWTGACSGTDHRCKVTVDGAVTVGAIFRSFALTATAPANGSIDGAGLNCGNTCKQTFIPGLRIAVQATPALGYVFDAWGGACAGQPNPCHVVMDAQKNVTASFKLVATRKISATAPAYGSIQGAGLNCGSNCTAPQTAGSKPPVYAVPALGYLFASWGGDCASQGQTCSLDMTADRAVSATFRSVGTATLTVTRMNGGLLQNQEQGQQWIWCGHDDYNNNATRCTAVVTKGTMIDIHAYPMRGKTFGSFSGACSGSDSTACKVVVDSNKTLGAVFK